MPIDRRLVSIARPSDIGSLGAYRIAAQTGTVNAGIAPLAPWLSFRWTSVAPNVALIRSIRVGLQSLTAFAAGNGFIDMVVARGFTASDTGGTAVSLTGNNGKLRTSMGSSLLGDFRLSNNGALGAGTRTLASNPTASINFAVTPSANTNLLASTTPLYGPDPNDWPLILAQDEGFVLRITVPATGTWIGYANVTWEELPGVPF